MKRKLILTTAIIGITINSFAFDARNKVYTKAEAKADKEYYESRGVRIYENIEKSRHEFEPYPIDKKELQTSNNFKEMFYDVLVKSGFDTITGITLGEAKRALDNKLILIGEAPEYVKDAGNAYGNIAWVEYHPIDKDLSLADIAQHYRKNGIHEMLELVFRSDNRRRLGFEGDIVWAENYLYNFSGDDLNIRTFSYHIQADIIEGIMAIVGSARAYYDCTKMPGGSLEKLQNLFEGAQDIIRFDVAYGYLIYSYQSSQRDNVTHIFNDIGDKKNFDSYSQDSDFVKFLKSIPHAKTEEEKEPLRRKALYFEKILQRDYNMLVKISDGEMSKIIGNYPSRIRKFRIAANNEYNLRLWSHEHPFIENQTAEAFSALKSAAENPKRIRNKLKKTKPKNTFDFHSFGDKNRFIISRDY